MGKMRNNEIARELIKIAKLLLGNWVFPESNISDKVVRRRERDLKQKALSLPEKASMLNTIDSIAMNGKDPSSLTLSPLFKGWGRGDFIRLNRRLNNR